MQMDLLDALVGWFDNVGGAMVALSGGVDSALVAHAAFARLGGSAVAVTADYSTLSQDELSSAESVCTEIGIRHIVIKYDELENPDFVKNDNARCYHCRTELGYHLTRLAKTMNGSYTIVDGTNVDDLGDYRPGIEAMKKYEVRSPLVEVGFTKDDVRRAARMVGLSVFDRPSNSCLASRIPWGERITAQRLARIELGERIVRQISGARQVRVRDIGGSARIEVGQESLYMFTGRQDFCSADCNCNGTADAGCDLYRNGPNAKYAKNPNADAGADCAASLQNTTLLGVHSKAFAGRHDACSCAPLDGDNNMLDTITEKLVMIGFDGVTIDPLGYRPGNANGAVSDR